mmetsp:Transcript_40713/g.45893  ORF Transcript_40713/g.45893 Transcript_40713/m.45893 type:complete len:86 (+) Transcript_40713:356-613(+)
MHPPSRSPSLCVVCLGSQMEMDMYQRLLVEYQTVYHSTTKVPRHWKQDPPLGSWIFRQRQAYQKKSSAGFSPQRWELLHQLDFFE